MYKHAALSPAIQALEQTPTAEAQKQIFEQQLGEQAYATFAAKFPDLVESIITFKTLDSDPDVGTAFGAFILDLGGESAYVPVVFADSEISPIEIMYVKSTDSFVPFTSEWVDATLRGSDKALGEAAKLPDTVPTDVDIRNLVVPPTTGRYSYAAEASAPLGRSVTKRANEQFDPVMWESFIEQYSRMNGVTPGVALDQGQMGIDELSKLYKSHMKTWAQPQQQPMTQPAAPQGMPTEAAQPGAPAPMYPKTAGIGQSAGKFVDEVGSKALESAALGGLTGGLTGVYDDDYRNIGSRMARGAIGGGLGGAAGHMIGSHINTKHPGLTQGLGDEIGQLLGAVGGGLSARPDLPSAGGDPYGSFRYAAAEDGVLSFVKHAASEAAPRSLKLLSYLDKAPNAVKTAFASVLKKRPKLLKYAAEAYGTEELLGALRAHTTEKKAGISTETVPGLRVSEDRKGSKAFGARSPLAFRGIQMRGYYYEDKKPAKNLAVIQQEYHDVHDAREPGVYKVWKMDGKQEPVLVLVNPTDLLGEDREFFPKDTSGFRPKYRYPDGGRLSHEARRLIIRGDGTFCNADEVHGEQVTESALEGSKVFKKLFSDAPAAPAAGLGIFVYKTGTHYYGTRPVELSAISKSSSGVLTATAKGWYGYPKKTLKMDSRVPMSRAMRPKDQDFVLVPSDWRWMPLKGESEEKDILFSATAVIDRGLNALGSMGAHKVNVVSAGANMASVDSKPQMPKVAALKYLADTHDISGADAEAMLKIAEIEGVCRVLIAPKIGLEKRASPLEMAFNDILGSLTAQMQQVQDQIQVLQPVIQRAQELAQDPNAMQATDPAMQPAPAAGAPSGGAPPVDAAGPAVGQAPSAPAGGPPPIAAAQAPEPEMPPAAGAEPPMDPAAAAGGAPAPMPPMPPADPNDPNAGMPPEQPPLPMMGVEGPSSTEIAQEINPEFLEQAAELQDQGVFDVGALNEIDRAAGRAGGANPAPLEENARDLSATVDDLGRTLLMLQLRQVDLQEQLSNDTYKELEQQVRNTFQGLGKLMLDMKQHSSALSHVQATNAS